jgi:hypothetical protein
LILEARRKALWVREFHAAKIRGEEMEQTSL